MSGSALRGIEQRRAVAQLGALAFELGKLGLRSFKAR